MHTIVECPMCGTQDSVQADKTRVLLRCRGCAFEWSFVPAPDLTLAPEQPPLPPDPEPYQPQPQPQPSGGTEGCPTPIFVVGSIVIFILFLISKDARTWLLSSRYGTFAVVPFAITAILTATVAAGACFAAITRLKPIGWLAGVVVASLLGVLTINTFVKGKRELQQANAEEAALREGAKRDAEERKLRQQQERIEQEAEWRRLREVMRQDELELWRNKFRKQVQDKRQ